MSGCGIIRFLTRDLWMTEGTLFSYCLFKTHPLLPVQLPNILLGVANINYYITTVLELWQNPWSNEFGVLSTKRPHATWRSVYETVACVRTPLSLSH